MGLLAAASLWGHACTSPTPEARSSAPADRIDPTLRRVLRADGSEAFYLLGSVHVGRGAPPSFSPTIEKAYARSAELVLEFDPTSPLSERDSERLMQRYAVIAPPESLRDRVSSGTLVALDALLHERGEPLAPYLGFEPWFLVELLGDEAKRRRGLDPAYGVDRSFAERAKGRKAIVELETAELQLRVLSDLPAEIHELRLLEFLVQPDEPGRRAAALLRAWEQGDDRALERILFEPLKETPELGVFYERLIFERNERMTRRLVELAQDGKLRFAVVGAGHLVGSRGIPALLHRRGFQIERRRQ